MTARRIAALTALLWALTPPAAGGQVRAHSPDRWQVTLAGGAIEWDVRLVKIDGDSLRLTRADSAFALPIEQITEVRLIRKSEVRLGGADGGVLRALTGGDDEVYDLLPLDFAGKIKVIRKILLDHPPGQVPAPSPAPPSPSHPSHRRGAGPASSGSRPAASRP